MAEELDVGVYVVGYEDDVSLFLFLALACLGAVRAGEGWFEAVCDCGRGVFEGDEFRVSIFELVCCVAYEFAIAVGLVFFDSEVTSADFGLPVFARDSRGDTYKVEGV